MVLVIDPVTKFGKYAHQELVNANRNPGVPTEEAKGQDPAATTFTPVEEVMLCPITLETIREPAMTIHGQLYEHQAVLQWVRVNGTDPMTQQPLNESQIYPQYTLKTTIVEM